MREQNIMLFGRKIFLMEHDGSREHSGETSDESNDGGGGGKYGVEYQSMDILEAASKDHKIVNSSSDSDNDPEAPVIEEKNCKPKLKKPDEILPCPRCNSSETKFCYYNNYNIKQPRHFCKSCQRYWTAGGTMRNVPIGAGKRKSKNSASQYPHIIISDTFLAERIGASSNGFQNIKFEQNGTVLSLGRNSIPIPIPIPNPKSIPPPAPGAPAPLIPLTFPWNSAVPVPIPIPIPIISPPPCWNSNLLHHSNTNSTLRKHSRNGEIHTTYPYVVPKTLRIDDPEEAAKSSICSTLGINVNPDPFRLKNTVFHGLQPKNDKETMAAVSSLWQANPAALSRSIIFRETA